MVVYSRMSPPSTPSATISSALSHAIRGLLTWAIFFKSNISWSFSVLRSHRLTVRSLDTERKVSLTVDISMSRTSSSWALKYLK